MLIFLSIFITQHLNPSWQSYIWRRSRNKSFKNQIFIDNCSEFSASCSSCADAEQMLNRCWTLPCGQNNRRPWSHWSNHVTVLRRRSIKKRNHVDQRSQLQLNALVQNSMSVLFGVEKWWYDRIKDTCFGVQYDDRVRQNSPKLLKVKHI